MSALSRGIIAFAYELGALVLLFGFAVHSAALAMYFTAHGVASGLAALTLLPLLPRQSLDRPLAGFLFLFALGFFLPVLGVMGMLGAASMARLLRGPAPARRLGLHAAPVYDPRAGEMPKPRSRGGVRVHLADVSVPIDARLRALLTLQSMPARMANPVIRDMLADPSEDLRLIAYGILDTREKTINARIQAATRQLAHLSAGATTEERAGLEKQLAELYWELIYQGLVQGELRAHAAGEARAHLERALAVDRRDPALHALAGQIALGSGDYESALHAFRQALALGLAECRVLPYLAEVAFRTRRFEDVRAIARRLASFSPADVPSVPRVQQVIEYWRAA